MANATADPVQTAVTTANIDPAPSAAEFKVKHMMISNVKGQFLKLSGTLSFDEASLANSRINVFAEAASIHTGDAQRDAHLKSADFFDASGWAADYDSPDASIPVAVYVGVPLGTGTGLGWFTAGTFRADVNQFLNSSDNHGFSFSIGSCPTGTPVYIYAC